MCRAGFDYAVFKQQAPVPEAHWQRQIEIRTGCERRGLYRHLAAGTLQSLLLLLALLLSLLLLTLLLSLLLLLHLTFLLLLLRRMARLLLLCFCVHDCTT